ncbi:hypothetical protein D3C85_1720370 [compost metagenome]
MQLAGRQLPGVALPALEAAFAQREAFEFAQRTPRLVQAVSAPVPGQRDIGGGVEQQAEGSFGDGPG